MRHDVWHAIITILFSLVSRILRSIIWIHCGLSNPEYLGFKWYDQSFPASQAKTSAGLHGAQWLCSSATAVSGPGSSWRYYADWAGGWFAIAHSISLLFFTGWWCRNVSNIFLIPRVTMTYKIAGSFKRKNVFRRKIGFLISVFLWIFMECLEETSICFSWYSCWLSDGFSK